MTGIPRLIQYARVIDLYNRSQRRKLNLVGPVAATFALCHPDELEAVLDCRYYSLRVGEKCLISADLPTRWIAYEAFHLYAQHQCPLKLGFGGRDDNVYIRHHQSALKDIRVPAEVINEDELGLFLQWRRSLSTAPTAVNLAEIDLGAKARPEVKPPEKEVVAWMETPLSAEMTLRASKLDATGRSFQMIAQLVEAGCPLNPIFALLQYINRREPGTTMRIPLTLKDAAIALINVCKPPILDYADGKKGLVLVEHANGSHTVTEVRMLTHVFRQAQMNQGGMQQPAVTPAPIVEPVKEPAPSIIIPEPEPVPQIQEVTADIFVAALINEPEPEPEEAVVTRKTRPFETNTEVIVYVEPKQAVVLLELSDGPMKRLGKRIGFGAYQQLQKSGVINVKGNCQGSVANLGPLMPACRFEECGPKPHRRYAQAVEGQKQMSDQWIADLEMIASHAKLAAGPKSVEAPKPESETTKVIVTPPAPEPPQAPEPAPTIVEAKAPPAPVVEPEPVVVAPPELPKVNPLEALVKYAVAKMGNGTTSEEVSHFINDHTKLGSYADEVVAIHKAEEDKKALDAEIAELEQKLEAARKKHEDLLLELQTRPNTKLDTFVDKLKKLVESKRELDQFLG